MKKQETGKAGNTDKPSKKVPSRAVREPKSQAEKPNPNLEHVEYYDTGYGIALDDDGEVYKFQSLRDDRRGEPEAFDYLKKLTLSEALEWMADMDEVEGVGSSHYHPRFFRLIAAKLRDADSKPERPVSELQRVQEFEIFDAKGHCAKPMLSVDDRGCYYVSDDEGVAKRVTLKQASKWFADKWRGSINAGGITASEPLPDFLAKVAEKLPEGV